MAEWFYRLRDMTVVFAGLMLVRYWLFLMIAPWHSAKEELRQIRIRKYYPERIYNYAPLVSVIVPAWNEEVGILRTISSLLNNTYPHIEIVVVNDGSTDASHKVVIDFLKQREHDGVSNKLLKYYYKENGGKGTALNHGIERARGEIIVTMDADSIFHHQAIERLVSYFRDPSISAAVGNVKIANNGTLVGQIQSLEYQFGFYFKRAHSVLNAEYIYGGACAAFRRSETFDSLGLFDTLNKTEDIEMSLRTKYAGLKAVFAENVICYTEGASTITGLVNQRLRWKKGRLDTLVKYRQMFFSLKKHHNNWLCFFILPYSLLGELQLLFEPIGIALLLSYSIISGDYLSLGLGIFFIFVTYFVVACFNFEKFNWRILLKFPFTWPLFYVTTWIEYMVLLRSIKMAVRGHEIDWQRWERKGVDLKVVQSETKA